MAAIARSQPLEKSMEIAGASLFVFALLRYMDHTGLKLLIVQRQHELLGDAVDAS